MKNIIIITLTVLSSLLKSQTTTSSEKMAIQLDSISKADDIKVIGIYAYKNYSDNIIDHILASSQTYKFKGQFIILNENEKFPQYFNLDKLINFNIVKKDKRIQLYFQIH